MNSTLQQILVLLAETLLPVVVGFVLARNNLISERFKRLLVLVNVRVVFTVLSFIAFWKVQVDERFLLVPAAGLALTFIPYGIVRFTSRGVADPAERGAWVISGMLSNIGTLGGLVCYMLLGAVSYAYVQLAAAMQNLVTMLFCFPMCQKYRDLAEPGGVRIHRSFAELLFTWNQLGLVGMAAGAVFSVAAVPRPDSLDAVFDVLIYLSAWLQFLPIGIFLRPEALRQYLVPVLRSFPLLKFVVMPAIIWALSALMFSDPVVIATLVILASCPCAINAVLSCELFGLKTDVAEASFIITTVLFALVVCPVFFVVWG